MESIIIQRFFPLVDGGSVNAFLAAALTRVMRAAVPIPAVASASVLHSAAVGVVRHLTTFQKRSSLFF